MIRPITIQRQSVLFSKTSSMALITSHKRQSSSLDAVSDYDNVEQSANSFQTDLQIRQRLLLSEDGDHDEICSGNGCINSNLNKVSPLTPFQRKVYTALCLVPEGYVTTYQSIGSYIHCSSSQAIGQALKRNPYAPIIPCHRVIKSNGTIGGFHGHTSGQYIASKISLLQNEGVEFIHHTNHSGKANVYIDPKCFFDFDSNMNKKLPSSEKTGRRLLLKKASR